MLGRVFQVEAVRVVDGMLLRFGLSAHWEPGSGFLWLAVLVVFVLNSFMYAWFALSVGLLDSACP